MENNGASQYIHIHIQPAMVVNYEAMQASECCELFGSSGVSCIAPPNNSQVWENAKRPAHHNAISLFMDIVICVVVTTFFTIMVAISY